MRTAISAGRYFTFLALFLCVTTLSARPFLVLFGSESCDECQSFKQLYLEKMTLPEAPLLVYVCIDDNKEYLFLNTIEKALHSQNVSSKFPVLLAGEHLIYGSNAIETNFTEILTWANTPSNIPELADIRRLAENTPGNYATWKKEDATDTASSLNANATVSEQYHILYLETSKNCRHCERQEKELSLLQHSLPGLSITQCEVSTQEGQLLYLRLLNHFNIDASDENLAPLVAWESGYIAQRLAKAEELTKILKEQSAKTTAADTAPFWSGKPTKEELARLAKNQNDFLSRTTLATTVLAGLLDGINPCAFATVIFLISYLLYLKRGHRFILAVGLCFCTGVFLSYLLFGLGLSFLVDILNSFTIIKTIIYGIFALAGLILSILHLRDALRFRHSQKTSQMMMGLNSQTHRKIHDKIHNWGKISTALALPAAIVLGCVVSSMEFVCTGQIYLPMLMAINSRGFNSQAFLSLILYNLAFILPLIAVSCLAYCGVGAQSLAKWAQEHIFMTKILMAILFLLLAILMLAMLLL